jgi:nitrogen fixation protein FixH
LREVAFLMALISQSNKQAFRNPWVLGWIAMVTIVFSVNIYFITTAFTTTPGLVSKHYYDAGRDLEERINSRAAERSKLGWSLELETGEIHMARPATFRLGARDKAGKPLTGAQVVAHAYRPSDSAADFSTSLFEKSPGQYEAMVTFPLKGRWDLVVDVKQGESNSEVPRRIAVLAN